MSHNCRSLIDGWGDGLRWPAFSRHRLSSAICWPGVITAPYCIQDTELYITHSKIWNMPDNIKWNVKTLMENEANDMTAKYFHIYKRISSILLIEKWSITRTEWNIIHVLGPNIHLKYVLMYVSLNWMWGNHIHTVQFIYGRVITIIKHIRNIHMGNDIYNLCLKIH